MSTKAIDFTAFFDLQPYAHQKLFDGGEAVWTALGRLAAYLESAPLGEILSPIPEGCFLEETDLIRIEEGVTVEPGAFIRGPCWIGSGSVIRHGAYIRGGVVTGEHCVIGHSTEIKNSILLNKAQAAHFAYVGDSILGNQVNLGAGTRLANLKLAGDEVCIRIGSERVGTGRRKLGAIIGDRAQLGCNSVTNPGTLIYPDSFVLPCKSVSGVIDRKKIGI